MISDSLLSKHALDHTSHRVISPHHTLTHPPFIFVLISSRRFPRDDIAIGYGGVHVTGRDGVGVSWRLVLHNVGGGRRRSEQRVEVVAVVTDGRSTILARGGTYSVILLGLR